MTNRQLTSIYPAIYPDINLRCDMCDKNTKTLTLYLCKQCLYRNRLESMIFNSKIFTLQYLQQHVSKYLCETETKEYEEKGCLYRD